MKDQPLLKFEEYVKLLEAGFLEQRAAAIVLRYSENDNSQNRWVIDQILRLIAGEAYPTLIKVFEAEYGVGSWDIGKRPGFFEVEREACVDTTNQEMQQLIDLFFQTMVSKFNIRYTDGTPAISPSVVRAALQRALAEIVGTPSVLTIWNDPDGLKINARTTQ